MVSWQLLTFNELTNNQLFDLLKLRVDVFVVEQNCAYPELDEKDRHPQTRHLMGFQDNRLVACARLLSEGVSYPSVSIGRVATSEVFRGKGAGKALMREAINHCEALWPGCDIEIGAQEYLKRFYESFGFEATSTMYLEDDIPHIDMKRAGMARS
jgi:ElaA protein